jgi:hypothetical protein
MAREARVELEGAVPSHARQGVQTDGTRAVELRADGRQMIAAKQIAKFATERLEEYRFKDSEFGGPALKSGVWVNLCSCSALTDPAIFITSHPGS